MRRGQTGGTSIRIRIHVSSIWKMKDLRNSNERSRGQSRAAVPAAGESSSKEGARARGPAPSVRRARVDEASAGQRLDNYLIRELKGVPRSHVYRVIRDGQVRVNGRRGDATQRLE